MEYPMRLKLTRVSLLVFLAKHYTILGTLPWLSMGNICLVAMSKSNRSDLTISSKKYVTLPEKDFIGSLTWF